jgi:uncharacterized protein (DUF2141 family)
MKIYFVLLFYFISVYQLFAQDSLEVNLSTGNLVVIVKNFENNKGMARIALNNSKGDYKKRGEAYLDISSEIDSNNTAKVVFENIPYGVYALKTFHDEDDDNELDKNFIGIPSEDYGFSNNASGSFGPPDWEDAKFLFESDNQIHEIDLNK